MMLFVFIFALLLCVQVESFTIPSAFLTRSTAVRASNPSPPATPMLEITPSIKFNTLAREWRCKFPDPSKGAEALNAVQATLDSLTEEIKGIHGVRAVKRIVCGGCMDYKVIISLSINEFKKWEEAGFYPEEKFVSGIKAIEGVTMEETQTYTLMSVYSLNGDRVGKASEEYL